MLIEKPFTQPWGRHHTAFLFTKPFIPVTGNDVIKKIPDEFWDDD